MGPSTLNQLFLEQFAASEGNQRKLLLRLWVRCVASNVASNEKIVREMLTAASEMLRRGGTSTVVLKNCETQRLLLDFQMALMRLDLDMARKLYDDHYVSSQELLDEQMFGDSLDRGGTDKVTLGLADHLKTSNQWMRTALEVVKEAHRGAA